MMVEPEGVIADEQGSRGIFRNRVFRCDVTDVVVRDGTVGKAQDDFEQAVRGRGLGCQDDFVILERLDGLARDEQDAFDIAVRRNADIGQHDEFFAVARVDDGRDVADVKAVVDNIAVELRRYAARQLQPFGGPVRIAPGERQYVQEIDMSDSWTGHKVSPFFIHSSLSLYTLNARKYMSFLMYTVYWR